MDQFNRKSLLPTTAAELVPPHRRNPQRITVTISWRLHQRLLDRSDMEGRSLSNLAAHLLEDCFQQASAL